MKEDKFLRSGGRVISHNPTGPQPRPGSKITIDEDIYISREGGYSPGDVISSGLYSAKDLLDIIKREFENPQNPVQLVIIADPTNGGFVSSSGEYRIDESVLIEAVANQGFTFKGWSTGNSEESFELIMDNDRTITAYFEEVVIHE